MQSNAITLDEMDITPEYQRAIDLHYSILTNAETAASAMIGLCKNLKEMRDLHLYTRLGHDTFDDYVEKAVGLKRRQAYNYIMVLERLPAAMLDEQAHLGITKLELLAQVPALDRDSFLEEHDVEDMSTREIRELVDQIKAQGEQLTFLQEQNDELQKAKEELDEISGQEDAFSDLIREKDAELEALQKKLSEMEQRPIDVAVQAPDEAELQKIRDDAKKQAEKNAADKIKAAKEKAKKAADKQVADAKAEAVKTAEERFQQSLALIEQEKAAAMERATELERQLKTTGNQDTVALSLHFGELSHSYDQIVALIEKNRSSNPEIAEKFKAALVKSLESLCERAANM